MLHSYRPAGYAARPFCPVDLVLPGYRGVDGAQAPGATLEGEFCGVDRMVGGAAVGDYNGDGLQDVFIPVAEGPSQLYKNNGDGTFQAVTNAANIHVPKHGSGAVFADFNGDGYDDLYVTTYGGEAMYMFINNGHGVFTEEARARGVSLATSPPRRLRGMTPAVGDIDGDGFADLYVTEYVLFPSIHNRRSVSRLFINAGAANPGSFSDVTDAAGLNRDAALHSKQYMFLLGPSTQDFGAAFVDLDDDGHQDLVVVGDSRTLTIYWNNGLLGSDLAFDPCSNNTGGDHTLGQCGYTPAEGPMGLAFGDLDRDGKIDFFVTSAGPRGELNKKRTAPSSPWDDGVGNRLYFNLGTRCAPFYFTPMGVNSISSGSPHVRPMRVHCTCGEPDGIKKSTHPKYVTALVRNQAGGRSGARASRAATRTGPSSRGGTRSRTGA